MIELGDHGLSRDEYIRVVRKQEPIGIADGLPEKLQETRARMLAHVGTGVPAYGVTTGLGHLARVRVDSDDQAELQRSLLTARAAGVDPPLDAEVVRGAMVLRLAGFLHGAAGVTPELCGTIADRLNDGWSPLVPAGPYGAAGEIGPLAHLFQTLIGEGLVLVEGTPVAAAAALSARGLRPYEPRAKEGLALINGSPFATALAIRLADRSRALVDTATVAAALAVALARSGARALSVRVGSLQGDPFITAVQERLSALLAAEDLWDDRAQPPVSTRVVPQVHGAALRTLAALDAVVDGRLRGTTDSPLFLDGDESSRGLYPSGAFHAVEVVVALEALANACCHVLNLVEKRLHRLLDGDFSGLPDQLTTRPGVQAGVVVLHKTVVALAAEGRTLATPASVHAIDTSSGQEDVQSFTFLVASRVDRLLDVLETALACELVALRQAAYVASHHIAGAELDTFLTLIADTVQPVERDRSLTPDIERARLLVRDDAVRLV